MRLWYSYRALRVVELSVRGSSFRIFSLIVVYRMFLQEFQIFLATKLRPLVVPKNEDVINFADEGGDM